MTTLCRGREQKGSDEWAHGQVKEWGERRMATQGEELALRTEPP